MLHERGAQFAGGLEPVLHVLVEQDAARSAGDRAKDRPRLAASRLSRHTLLRPRGFGGAPGSPSRRCCRDAPCCDRKSAPCWWSSPDPGDRSPVRPSIHQARIAALQVAIDEEVVFEARYLAEATVPVGGIRQQLARLTALSPRRDDEEPFDAGRWRRGPAKPKEIMCVSSIGTRACHPCGPEPSSPCGFIV